MQVINQLVPLIGKKQQETGQMITLAEVSRATKIPYNTLLRWADQAVTRFDASVIMPLCDYFECEVGDLIIYKREMGKRKAS